MANRQINWEVNFNVNKSSLDQITQSLRMVRVEAERARIKDNLTDELKGAAKAAEQLTNILDSAWNTKLNQLDLSKVNTGIKNTYGSVDILKQKMEGSGKAGSLAYNQFASEILKTNVQIKQSSEFLDKMATTMANTVRYGISSSIFNNITNTIQKAYAYSIDLDKSLNNIRVVTNKSAEDMEKFAVQANKAAKALGTKTTDYTDASLIYYQQGLADQEVAARTEVTLKAANVTQQSAQEVSEQLTAVWNGYKVTASEAELYIDKLSAVAANSASNLQELSSGMSKVASTANSVGVDIDQLNAQMSTIISVTRQAPESIGTALRTIYARMTDIKAGIDEDGVTLGKYTSSLAAMGVNVLDANGKLREMGEIIEEVGNKWTGYSKEQQIALAQIMGGQRQYNYLVALFDNWSDYNRTLEISKNSVGELQKQQDIYMESTEAHLTKLRTESERTYDILFDTKAVNTMSDAMTGLLSIFNDFLAGLGGGLNTITYLGSTIAGVFNKQIGGALQRVFSNIEIDKTKQDLEDLSNEIKSLYAAKGEPVSEAKLNAEIGVAQQFQPYRSIMTPEQAQQVLELQTAMGAQEEKRVQLEKEYQAVAAEYIKNKQAEAVTEEDFENVILQLEKEKSKIQENVASFNEKALHFHEMQTGVIEYEASEYNQIKNYLLDQLKYMEDSFNKNNLINKLKNDEKITESDILKIEQARKDNIDERIKKIEILTDAQNKQKQAEGIKQDEGYIKSDANRIQEQLEQQKILQNGIMGITTSINLLIASSGVIKTIGDDTLSAEEKFSRVFTVLLTNLPMLIMNLDKFKSIIPAATVGIENLAMVMNVAGAEAGMGFLPALIGIMGVIGPFIALAGVLGFTVYEVAKAYNADATAAKEAAESAKELNDIYIELNNSAKELKDTISDYSEAKDELSDLIYDADAYKEKLEEVNGKAKELIETYKLYDSVHMENGVISFNEGVLEDLKNNIESAKLQAESQSYTAEMTAKSAQLVSDTTDLIRKVGHAEDIQQTEINRQQRVKRNEFAGSYHVTQEDRAYVNITKEQTEKIVDALNKLKKEKPDDFTANTKDEESFAAWIASIDENDKNLQLLSTNIAKVKDDFIKLSEATNELTEYNKYAIDQIQQLSLQEKYSKQAEAVAKKNIKGEINQADLNQIYAAVSKFSDQQFIGDLKLQRRDVISKNKLDLASTWAGTSNKELSQMLAEFSNGRIQKQIDTNEDLAKEWARSVKHMTEEQIKALDFTKNKLIDPTTDKTIVDLSNKQKKAKVQAEIFSTETTQDIDEDIDERSSKITEANFNLLDNLRKQVRENGKEIGIDLSQEITNALANEGKIDMSQFFAKINPDEAEQLKTMSGEDIQKYLGLTDDVINEVGKDRAETLINSFSESMQNYQWDIDSAIAASMQQKNDELEAAGEGLSKKKLAQYKEDVEIYAKNLMQIADSSKEVAKELEYDSDTAVDFALRIIKMNKAIDILADNMEDWSDIVNKSSETSQEYAEAMYGLRDAIADVYDISMDYVSNDFISEHLSEIEKIAKGDESAIEGLRNELSKEVLSNIIQFNIDTQKLEIDKQDLLNTFSSLRQELQGELDNLVVGQNLDSTHAVEELQKIIDGAHMTEEQANSFLSQIGYEPVYEEREMIVPKRTKKTETRHTMTAQKQVYDELGNAIPGLVEWTTTDEVVDLGEHTSNDTVAVWGISGDGNPPKIKELKKAPGGSMNNYSSSNKGGKAPGSSKKSGGSSKKAQKEKPIESKRDPYHDIDIKIKAINTDIDRLSTAQTKLFGQTLINNLIKQYELLGKQIDADREKIEIARHEQQRLAAELSGKGVQFNADGTIANYAEAYQAQLNYVNGLIEQYNNMSAEAQESFKDTLDQAKEDFNKFTENISEYDKTITDIIPGLEDDIQSAIDKQIEINIQQFDMEIDIRLNMAEAERDWNAFKKKVIDDIKDTDILGGAKATLQDYYSYYKTNGTGAVQAGAAHVNDVLAQLTQMDRTGVSNVYGDNRTAALEDLDKYYKQLMSDMEGVADVIEEVRKSYLAMMEKADKALKDQLDTYEQISDLINHDMKVIQLVYGEKAYSQLSKYYKSMEDNYNKQLDFQKQQVEFWKQQMDTTKEGTDEWKKAKEEWTNAVDQWNSAVESAIENLQDKYLNTINEIFQELNNKVTSGMGLEYVNEQWELINKNADQYLDTINATYGVQQLQKKYQDAIDNTKSVSEQRRLNKLMNDEISALEQQDKLTKYDLERAELKYQIALKRIALEEAQKNKSTMRLKRDSQGNYSYQYVSDDDQIGSVKEEIDDLYNRLYNLDLDRYQNNLDQIYSVWEEFQQKLAEAAQINDPEEREARELLLKEQYAELINGLIEQNETVRTNMYESSFLELAQFYDTDYEAFAQLAEDKKEVLMDELIPYWTAGVQSMADAVAAEGGLIPTCQEAFGELDGATKDYEEGLKELQASAGVSFGEIADGIDRIVWETQDLLFENNELINKYQDELIAIQAVIDELNMLIAQYKAAEMAAIAATTAAYKYWMQANNNAANAAKTNSQGGSNIGSSSIANQTQFSTTGKDANVSGTGSGKAGAAAGDGILSVGDTATFSGKYYYDSFGTSPAGSKYSGVANGIVVDKVTNNPYGIHIKSADGKYIDLGWVKKSQLTGYDTGGYTGNWNNTNGRLALLHQKEIVLNADDTMNFLNAIKIMRSITDNIGSTVLAQLAGAKANIGNNLMTSSEQLEQNVHIQANFPNVTNSQEIEHALDNLILTASQRANRNNR